jgi:hypothetical protein
LRFYHIYGGGPPKFHRPCNPKHPRGYSRLIILSQSGEKKERKEHLSGSTCCHIDCSVKYLIKKGETRGGKRGTGVAVPGDKL